MGLILGTDGLWDELGKSSVLQTIVENRKKPLAKLLEKSLEAAANSHNISLSTLKKISLGKSRRRNYHDDISMVYVNLE